MAKNDEVKFTEEELQSLNDLQVKYNTITNQFGQLAIAKINLDKQNDDSKTQRHHSGTVLEHEHNRSGE